jgi:hypothetical protein
MGSALVIGACCSFLMMGRKPVQVQEEDEKEED